MSADLLYSFAVQGLWTTAVVLLPMIAAGILVGLSFSLVQALTQINEAALTLVVKLLVMGVVGALTLPWIAEEMKNLMVVGFTLAAKI